MRIGVVTFPGSLDDRDAQRAVREAGGEAVALWHGDQSKVCQYLEFVMASRFSANLISCLAR